MDPTTLVLPGAQSLVTAVLSDTWEQAKAALARLWARRHPGPTGTGTHTYSDTAADADPGAVARAALELEAVRGQALELAGTGNEAERAARMQLFLAGYLAGQLAARPELAETVRVLPELLGTGATYASSGDSHNLNTGTVRGSVLQARDIHGDVHFR